MKHFYRMSVFLLIFSLLSVFADALTIIADSSNYTSFLSKLQPGDTLLLKKGDYSNGLRLNDLHGEAGRHIVITGVSNSETIFEGKSGRNTVSITKCSYLTIKSLKLDGKGLPVDAVKAEGTKGNYAHDIILEDLYITNHHSNLQIVGISTKCPAWNWIIRRNVIDYAGTGIYLGNSDGTKPFVNGIIEYNLIMHTIGYCMEIKHQNEGLRTLPGMPKNGKTIIRYNVFSREPVEDIKQSQRPNLLVGNFPAKGDGSDDYYEIYGNFFWQNPNEALFQGTGNIALYSNIFVNHYEADGFRAVYITKHKNFKPRNIAVFHNTVYAKNPYGGIRLYSADKEYKQYAWTNAVFSPSPITNFNEMFENVTDDYEKASEYVINASSELEFLDLYPQTGKLFAEAVDMSLFDKYTDFDLDFNGEKYNEAYRGAYSGDGENPGWKLALEIRPPVGTPTDVRDFRRNEQLSVYPNPADDFIEVLLTSDIIEGTKSHKIMIDVYDLLGRCVLSRSAESSRIRIDVSDLMPGVYFVRTGGETTKFIKL